MGCYYCCTPLLLVLAPNVCKINFTFYDDGSIDVTTNKIQDITQVTYYLLLYLLSEIVYNFKTANEFYL